jgi:hypothetical protein
MDPRIQIRIRIHTKMSWIRNTGGKKLKYKHEGSVVDLCQFGKDPDPRIRTTDPALFVRGLQEANKKYFCLLLLKVHLHHFSKI